MGGGKLEYDFLTQTSEMTHSNRNSVGNNDSSLPTPISKQLSIIIIDVLDEMSSGTLYTAQLYNLANGLALRSWGNEVIIIAGGLTACAKYGFTHTTELLPR